jgi:hypothetical protein
MSSRGYAVLGVSPSGIIVPGPNLSTSSEEAREIMAYALEGRYFAQYGEG